MTITLIGGPCHSRQIQDLGTTRQKIAIYRPAPSQHTEAGYAIYEPSHDRTLSFWLTNLWDGSILVPSSHNLDL